MHELRSATVFILLCSLTPACSTHLYWFPAPGSILYGVLTIYCLAGEGEQIIERWPVSGQHTSLCLYWENSEVLCVPMYVLIMEEDLLFFNLLGEDARDCSWTLLLILYDTVKHLPSTSVWRWASQVMLVVKNPPANAEDTTDAGSIPGSGRSPEEGNGNPLQYSCLENSIDRGLQSMGLQRVGHDWAHTHTNILRYYSWSVLIDPRLGQRESLKKLERIW